MYLCADQFIREETPMESDQVMVECTCPDSTVQDLITNQDIDCMCNHRLLQAQVSEGNFKYSFVFYLTSA
jgi:hypothetical protein